MMHHADRLMELIAWNLYFYTIILSVCQLTQRTSFEHKDEYAWILAKHAFLPKKSGKRSTFYMSRLRELSSPIATSDKEAWSAQMSLI